MNLNTETATQLIKEIFGQHTLVLPKVLSCTTQVFEAKTDGLTIRCENDWYSHNGRIRLSIQDDSSGSVIVRYYDPETLERDFEEEEKEKREEANARND